MKHRHLNHEAWTPAAIDSCITRGRQEDWNELRRAALDDPKVMISLQLIRLSKNMPELAAGIFLSDSGKMKISSSEKTPKTC